MSRKSMAFSVGVFIVTASILLILSLVYVINKKGLFEEEVKYKLIAKNSQDIEEGMPVLLSGFEVAKVTQLSLNRSGEVLITISASKRNTKWFRVGSILTLDRPLIGKPKIILTSSMNKPILNNKVILFMNVKDDINSLINNLEPVIVKLNNILENVDTLSYSLADKNSSFQNAIVNIEKISQNIRTSPNLLHTLTGDENISKEFSKSIANLNNSLSSLNKLIITTDEGIVEIRENIIKPTNTNLNELDVILKDVTSKLKEIDSTVKVMGKADKDILYLKDEMKVWLEEVKELSSRINSIIGKEQEKDIEMP